MTHSSPNATSNKTTPANYLVVIYKNADTDNISEAIAFQNFVTYDEAYEYVDQHQKDVVSYGGSITIFEKQHKFVPGLVEDKSISDDEWGDTIDEDMSDGDEAGVFASDHPTCFTVELTLEKKPIKAGQQMHPGWGNPYPNPQMPFGIAPGQQVSHGFYYEPTAMSKPMNIDFSEVQCCTRRSFYLLLEHGQLVFITSPCDPSNNKDGENSIYSQNTLVLESPKYMFIDATENDDRELQPFTYSIMGQNRQGQIKGFLNVPLYTPDCIMRAHNGYPVVKAEDIRYIYT